MVMCVIVQLVERCFKHARPGSALAESVNVIPNVFLVWSVYLGHTHSAQHGYQLLVKTLVPARILYYVS